MSTSPTSPKIFAEGGETNHGLPLSPEKLQVVMDVQAVRLSSFLPPSHLPAFPFLLSYNDTDL